MHNINQARILLRSSRRRGWEALDEMFRILFPLYHVYIDHGKDQYQAFPFRTSLSSRITDPGLQVYRIDYNIPANPPLSVRRLVDELVQLAGGYYLGKAQWRWWWGCWQTMFVRQLPAR